MKSEPDAPAVQWSDATATAGRGSSATPARRAAGGLFALGGLLLAAFSWAGLLGWLVGEIVSDRTFITQFLEWAPTPAVFTSCAALFIAAWVCLRVRLLVLAPGPATKRLRRAVRWGWAALGVSAVYFFTAEAPIFRARPAAPAPGVDRFKVVFWNAAAWYQDGWEAGIGGADPDIAIIAGLGSTARLPFLQAMMKDTVSVVMAERFVVLSKRPIVRFGFTSLGVARGQGIDPRIGRRGTRRPDSGHALFFELLHPATDKSPAGSSIVHVVDLPSDLSLARWEVTAKARRVMDQFAGTVFITDELGRWVPEPEPAVGFPPPDLVIGDFNIPRGSASLEAVSRALPNAFDQAGRGYMASYPRRWPLVHIDQTFLAPGLRAFNYRLLDIGTGAHRVQAVDIERR